MRDKVWGFILIAMLMAATFAMGHQIGFNEGQLKASMGIWYCWIDGNGDALYSVTPRVAPKGY